MQKRINKKHYFIPQKNKQTNSELIKGFNVKAKIIKLLEENVGENVSELGFK